MWDRPAGLLLFLPVPLVLLLFTRIPLGAGASLSLGLLLVLTHRFYARPFARNRARRRCLWCGGPGKAALPLSLREPGGISTWYACCPAHTERLTGFMSWLGQRCRLVRGGILGSLALYLLLMLPHALDWSMPWSAFDAIALFQAGIAITVLPVGWQAPRAEPTHIVNLPLPFPVHIQSLIGTLGVIWLFRLVGLAWLVLAALHFAGSALAPQG